MPPLTHIYFPLVNLLPLCLFTVISLQNWQISCWSLSATVQWRRVHLGRVAVCCRGTEQTYNVKYELWEEARVSRKKNIEENSTQKGPSGVSNRARLAGVKKRTIADLLNRQCWLAEQTWLQLQFESFSNRKLKKIASLHGNLRLQ